MVRRPRLGCSHALVLGPGPGSGSGSGSGLRRDAHHPLLPVQDPTMRLFQQSSPHPR